MMNTPKTECPIESKRQELVEAAREAGRLGLVTFSSGNLSLKVDDQRMLVTAKGSWLGRLTPEQTVLCRMDDGSALDGRVPSVESRFHAGIFMARPDVTMVLHCQSVYATVVACTEGVNPEDFNLIPEVPFYMGTPQIVPYNSPGSDELSQSVVNAAREGDVIVLCNHGQVVLGRTVDEGLQKAGFFELACTVMVHSRSPRRMSEAGIRALRERARI